MRAGGPRETGEAGEMNREMRSPAPKGADGSERERITELETRCDHMTRVRPEEAFPRGSSAKHAGGVPRLCPRGAWFCVAHPPALYCVLLEALEGTGVLGEFSEGA